MAGRVGHSTGEFIRGNANPYLSPDLNELAEVSSEYDSYQWFTEFETITLQYTRLPEAHRRGVIGQVGLSFKDDFYERIHVSPSRMDLGTIASEQTRQISVWNAYTKDDANLTSVVMTNGGGLILTGPGTPLTMTPMQELFWSLRITPDGSPQINASILFDFSDVTDPLPVIITGTRAALLPIVPEVPVGERWQWLTDVQVSVDGTEQRVGLRRVPRRSLRTKLTFVSAAELREQYRTLLSAVGRLFIPYFQYATTVTAAAGAGTSSLQFDTGLADVRNDDYVVVIEQDQARLIQLDIVGSGSASTKVPLASAVPKGAVIVATFASFLPNDLAMQRAAVNEYGTANVNSDASFPRSSFQRPGSTAELTQLDGYYVLERRPLANEDIGHVFDTGQQKGDARTGLIDIYSYWDFTKVEQELEFLVRRIGRTCSFQDGVQEFDYWRKFLDEMKGSLKSFLMSTYRPDQALFSAVGSGSDSLVMFGPSYVDNYWPASAYHYITLSTPRGDHYAKVIAATKGVDGNSNITFEPALPNSPGWNDIRQISYLLKLRIADDEVNLEHYPIETIFKIRVRTLAE